MVDVGIPSVTGGVSGAQGDGIVAPFANWDPKTQGRRTDQGWDLQTDPNTPVLAAASGRIVYMHDPNGFGDSYPVLMLDHPIDGQTAIYYGHIAPGVPDGTRVTAGEPIGRTLEVPGGNAASDPGWLEMGFWGPNGPVGNGVAMKAALGAAAVDDSGTGSSENTGFAGGAGGSTSIPGHSDVPFDPNDPRYASISPADMNWLKQNAGQYIWMASDPEVSKLLAWIAENKVTDTNEITSLFSQTDFYKSHSAATRKWFAMYGNGPMPSADATQAIHDAQVMIEDKAGQMGVQLTKQQIDTLAVDFNYFGLTDQELQRAIGQYSTTSTPSASLASLQQSANQYLINVGDQQLQQWLVGINSGTMTQQNVDAQLQQLAIGKYPWMQQQITAGMTPQAILAPYAQELGSTLQIDPNNINFNDPRYAKLIQSTDPKTGMPVQTPLWQAVQQVKQDPTYGWQNTPDAKNQAFDTARQLEQLMGAIS